MAKKTCLEGKSWDILLRMCVNTRTEPSRKVYSTTKPVLMIESRLTAKTTTATADSMSVLSPALWICVILATLGSVLAVTLWFVIFRRQTRDSGSPDEAVPDQELLQKTEPPAKFHSPPSDKNGQAEMFQRAAEASSPRHQLPLGAQKDSEWEGGFTGCMGPARYGCKEGSGELPACSTMADHRVPLPATELGGTALVTTKTV
ncbi:uncharacterized protein PAE49_023148 [Odontesthes bonariensis]|uniref:uncharacterized protein LOC142371625 n=1 Tax=Odontesthes bonariensis TaxID=219752 RepID=UPI003F587F54